MTSVHDAIALLGRTPAALDALLRDLPDMWIRGNEGARTWSAFDIEREIGGKSFGQLLDHFSAQRA